ncbi:MAG TPA: hypothetical protein VF732_10495 [Nitrospira sp.]
MGSANRGIVSCSTSPTFFAAILFASLVFPITGQSEEVLVALEQPPAQLEVTGTLAKLDISAGKGMLLTDLEKPIFFRLDRPELFERLSIGDRVTMQLDDDGRVLKVIETLPAEVHEPLPPPK